MSETHKICTDCRGKFDKEEFIYLCPDCASLKKDGDSLKGIVKIEYDYDDARKFMAPEVLAVCKIRGQGRYAHILPIENIKSLPPLEVGPTPLDPAARLREKSGFKNLYIKNDTSLPTGSFKDRASSIIVAKAIEMRKKIVATASTGNAATALAGMAASVGLSTVIFVPEKAPPAKLTQIAMFGARLIPVKGTYDDAVKLCLEACNEFGWYNRNTGYNPYTIDAKKTAALEIWEQLGYKAPDKIFVPTGDGVILSGTHKGFYDLKRMGLIKKIPMLIPVQAEGSAAIVNAIESGSGKIKPLKTSKTIADSISVNNPACGELVLKIVEEAESFGVKVSDKDILNAMKELASNTGIFAEPAAAAAYAGFIKSRKRLDKNETIIVMITGSGLKDIPAAQKAVTFPKAIEPSLKSLKAIL